LAALVLATTPAPTEAKRMPRERVESMRGVIAGTVRHEATGEVIAAARVRLYCTCMQYALETTTDERGSYRFARLPPGAYTVDAQVEKALVGKRFRLPRNAKFRVNLWVDPNDDLPRLVDLEPAPEPRRFDPTEWVPRAVSDAQKNRMPAAFRHLENVEWEIPMRAY
jgi:hypothetical protein